MARNKQDALARAYAMLSSLRKNIDKMGSRVPETYVREFHAVLTKLEDIGIDVSEFRIPDSEITPNIKAIHTITFPSTPEGGVEYTNEKYVNKSFILTKLDAVLGYFEIITSEEPRKVGFTKSPSE